MKNKAYIPIRYRDQPSLIVVFDVNGACVNTS